MGRLRSSIAIAISTAMVASASASAATDGSVAGTVTAAALSSRVDIVVSLHAPGLTVKPPAAPIDLNQTAKLFVPHVIVAVTGTSIRFLNNDPFEHNVFSPEGRYDLGSWPQGQSKNHTFSKAGVYTQLCRIHPEMEAFIVVLDTPYFTKTDDKGAFQIAGVPPGHYTLEAWSEKLKGIHQPVIVEAGKPTAVQVALVK
jgi:plastocyanin